MGWELLLSAGAAPDVRRLERVDAAARRVPGWVDASFRCSGGAVLALARTEPAGGDAADLADGETLDAVVALSLAGVTAARTAGAGTTGAESGHVRVVVQQGEVTVQTDGVAFLPCYWAVHEGELLVSTHLATLVSLGLPARVDEQGLAEHLALLHPLGVRTVLDGAQALPPGGRLTWRPGTSADVVAAPLFAPSNDALDDDGVVRTFRDLWPDVLSDAVGRHPGRRLLQGLSGGLDSRAIATGLAALGERPMGYTYESGDSREAAVAVRVARRLGVPHLVVPVTPERRLARAARTASLLDGAHSVSQMYESWSAEVLRRVGDVVVNGLAGGPVWGDDKAVGLVDVEQVLDNVWGRYGSSALAVDNLLVLSGDSPSTRVRAGLATSLSSWDFRSREDMAVFWKLSNRQVRWGNMLVNALRRDGLGIEAPFLDRRVLALSARLTPEQRRNGRLYLRIHREVLTATADLPRSDDGNSPARLDHVYWSAESSLVDQLARLTLHHPISGARRAARRVVEVASARVAASTGWTRPADAVLRKTDVFPAELWVRTCGVYRDRLADLLEQAASGPGPWDREALQRAAATTRAGRPSLPVALLGNVATAGLWLRDHAERASRRSD